MWQAGDEIQRGSRRKEAAERPQGGFSLVVQPLGKSVEEEPFVAQPDGSRRELSPSEELYLARQKPRPRRKLA